MAGSEREHPGGRGTVIVLLLAFAIGVIAANWLIPGWSNLRDALTYEGDLVPIGDRFDGLAAGVVPASAAVQVHKVGWVTVGRQQVTLKNPGSVPVQFNATKLRDSGLQISMRPATVEVPAGETRKAWLWVAGQPPEPSHDVRFPVNAIGRRDGSSTRLKLVLPVKLHVVSAN